MKGDDDEFVMAVISELAAKESLKKIKGNASGWGDLVSTTIRIARARNSHEWDAATLASNMDAFLQAALDKDGYVITGARDPNPELLGEIDRLKEENQLLIQSGGEEGKIKVYQRQISELDKKLRHCETQNAILAEKNRNLTTDKKGLEDIIQARNGSSQRATSNAGGAGGSSKRKSGQVSSVGGGAHFSVSPTGAGTRRSFGELGSIPHLSPGKARPLNQDSASVFTRTNLPSASSKSSSSSSAAKTPVVPIAEGLPSATSTNSPAPPAAAAAAAGTSTNAAPVGGTRVENDLEKSKTAYQFIKDFMGAGDDRWKSYEPAKVYNDLSSASKKIEEYKLSNATFGKPLTDTNNNKVNFLNEVNSSANYNKELAIIKLKNMETFVSHMFDTYGVNKAPAIIKKTETWSNKKSIVHNFFGAYNELLKFVSDKDLDNENDIKTIADSSEYGKARDLFLNIYDNNFQHFGGDVNDYKAVERSNYKEKYGGQLAKFLM